MDISTVQLGIIIPYYKCQQSKIMVGEWVNEKITFSPLNERARKKNLEISKGPYGLRTHKEKTFFF